MAFACSVWAEEIAKLKGHNSKHWLVLGLLFGPVALIALAGYPDLEDRKHQRDSAAELSLIKLLSTEGNLHPLFLGEKHDMKGVSACAPPMFRKSRKQVQRSQRLCRSASSPSRGDAASPPQ